MEATRKNVYSRYDNLAKSSRHSSGLAETSSFVRPRPTLRSEVYRAGETYPLNKRQAPSTPIGVSNCYVFKSRLQEYAQKVGLSTPTYETIREGPSHEPSFTSTVIVGGVRYDSLPGFFSRKAAEQSAAEIALKELSTNGEEKESISVPVHETGLCKNVLQEYAQKMNYAIPTYIFQNDHTRGRSPFYTCTVEMGGIQYIGASANTKKEAEIKAARTALLAIQSSSVVQGELGNETNYAVVPCKRKVPETPPSKKETAEPRKRMNPRLNKRRKKNNGPPTGERDAVPHVYAHVDSPQLIIGRQEAQDGGNNALVVNTEASKQVDAVNSDSIVGTGGTGHDPTGPNPLFPGTGSVEQTPSTREGHAVPHVCAHVDSPQSIIGQQEAQDGDNSALVVNTESPKQVELVDAVNSDSMIGPGGAGHDPTDPNALFPGAGSVEQTPAGNAKEEASKE